MTYVPFDPATDNPEKRIPREPHETKVDPHEFVKAVDTTELKEQPVPKGRGAVIVPLVLSDLQERMRIGTERYGEPLKAFNGRNALQDAYEEALDKCVYLRQALEEARENAVQQDYFCRKFEEFLSTIRHKYNLSPDGTPWGVYTWGDGTMLNTRIKEMIGSIEKELDAVEKA
jgi:hypothetical protein